MRVISEAALNSLISRFGTKAILLPALLAALIAAAVFFFADAQRTAQLRADERAEVTGRLASLSARLQSNLNGNVMLLRGAASGIAINPQIGQGAYERLIAELFRVPSQIKAITAAPGMVVKWVYPLEKNKKVIGLDYRTDDQQRAGAIAARDSYSTILVGPIRLVQGGIGFIARVPIYTPDGKSQLFWGLLSGVIDVRKLYADSGLPDSELDIAISSVALPKDAKDVFYGQLEVFERDAVVSKLHMGFADWTIAGVPRAGWDAKTGFTFFRLCAATLAFCSVLPMFWEGLLARARQKSIVELQDRERELVKARQSVEYQSLHDSLTELPNRRFLDKFLACASDNAAGRPLSLIHVDLTGSNL